MADSMSDIELTDELAVALVEKLQEEATRMADAAAGSGSSNDGGASALRYRIEAWEAGRAGTVPEGWIPHLQQIVNERDEEYPNYLRLRNKFEGR